MLGRQLHQAPLPSPMCTDTSWRGLLVSWACFGHFFKLPDDHKGHGICRYWHPVLDFYFS